MEVMIKVGGLRQIEMAHTIKYWARDVFFKGGEGKGDNVSIAIGLYSTRRKMEKVTEARS